jgi:hypothetical protein
MTTTTILGTLLAMAAIFIVVLAMGRRSARRAVVGLALQHGAVERRMLEFAGIIEAYQQVGAVLLRGDVTPEALRIRIEEMLAEIVEQDRAVAMLRGEIAKRDAPEPTTPEEMRAALVAELHASGEPGAAEAAGRTGNLAAFVEGRCLHWHPRISVPLRRQLRTLVEAQATEPDPEGWDDRTVAMESTLPSPRAARRVS